MDVGDIQILGRAGGISPLLAMTQSIGREKREGLPKARDERDGEGREPLALLAIGPFGFEAREPLPLSRILLLPGTSAALAGHHPADCVISYGTAEKDSVGLSSIEEERMLISIQRELLTILGGVVPRKEILIPMRHGVQPLALLFWAGLSLVLGLTEQELWHIAETAF